MNQTRKAQCILAHQSSFCIVDLIQTLDAAVISAAKKAQLREELAVLQKKLLEAQKAAAAANKALASSLAVAAADAAAASGKSFVVTKMDVGLDTKVCPCDTVVPAAGQQFLAGLSGVFLSQFVAVFLAGYLGVSWSTCSCSMCIQLIHVGIS